MPDAEKTAARRLAFTRSPARLFVIIAASIFVAEVIVMLLLAALPTMPALLTDCLDAAILVGLVFPVLRAFAFAPLTRQLQALEEAEERLQEANQKLEQRTRDLEQSQLAALNMMEDAVRNREKAERAYQDLQREMAERKQVEAQFLQSQKMEAIGQLAGGIAHDFNNLLTVIQGSAGLGMETEGLATEVKEELREIYAACGRAANLTRQLLMFSRKQTIQPNTINLNEVVADLSKMLRRVIGEDVALECQLAPRLPAIKADVGMMEQVLMNLAINSRDAMANGGRLTLRTEVVMVDEAQARKHPGVGAGEFVRLSVRDTGCGMTPEVMAHVFEPFYTTKAPGKGTGLGLATVYGIVKQHEGWIGVESQAGAGTTFQLLFPALRSAAGAPTATATADRRTGGSETILLVEDEPSVRSLAKTILERLGYRVWEAGSGVSALDVWEEHADEIDPLLTDMVMPDGLTGRDLAQRLQAQHSDLKVLYSSGYSADLVAQRMIVQEGVNFLEKPYTAGKLAQAVRDCLDAGK